MCAREKERERARMCVCERETEEERECVCEEEREWVSEARECCSARSVLQVRVVCSGRRAPCVGVYGGGVCTWCAHDVSQPIALHEQIVLGLAVRLLLGVDDCS